MLAFKKKTYVLSSYNTLVLPVPTVTPVRLVALAPVSWGGSPAQTGQVRGAQSARMQSACCSRDPESAMGEQVCAKPKDPRVGVYSRGFAKVRPPFLKANSSFLSRDKEAESDSIHVFLLQEVFHDHPTYGKEQRQ